jgi:hypothetical protein
MFGPVILVWRSYRNWRSVRLADGNEKAPPPALADDGERGG